MTETAEKPAKTEATPAPAGEKPDPAQKKPAKKRRSWWRVAGVIFLILIALLTAVRLALPSVLLRYVNRTIDQHPMYDGEVGDIDVHLWRGAYAIRDIRLIKTTGNVPVPLFASPRVDLAIEWDALFAGEVVGRIVMERPELNFVDAESESEGQTGAGGPWLDIIEDLFPFRINSAHVKDGSIHFRAFQKDPPVDVYISQLNASVENLTNIHDEVTPMIATVKATGMALDHARLDYQMKIDPTSYRPTFQLALRLIGLDVTKTNDLARAYGQFDFEHGLFDLVVELEAKEGRVEGIVKPLFRDLRFLGRQDMEEDNILALFWEGLVGVAAEILENQPREQFGTIIPLTGDLTKPGTSILEVLGNVLYNAFVRAYLPRLEGVTEDIDTLQFGPGSLTDPVSVGEEQ